MFCSCETAAHAGRLLDIDLSAETPHVLGSDKAIGVVASGSVGDVFAAGGFNRTVSARSL